MKHMSLHEKITYKGLLSRKFPLQSFPRLDWRELLFSWHIAYGYRFRPFGKIKV